jgi:cytochrome P450
MVDIYQNENVSKSRSYLDGNMDTNTTNVFTVVDKRIHRIKRQLIGKLTSERSVKSFEPVMIEQIDIFLKQLLSTCTNETSDTINISERCKFLGLDISALMGFVYRMNLQTDENYRSILPAMVRGGWVINMDMQHSLLRKLRLGILVAAPMIRRSKGVIDVLRVMISARLAEDKHARHDLYSHLVDALDALENDRITIAELWVEAIFFLPAAGDTSATTLATLFFYLSRNPDCLQKLALEIGSKFATSSEILGGPQLASCGYLRACINESLRMSPPVGGTLWREQSKEDIRRPLVIDGHVIPAGTRIGLNIYALHHNPAYFPDPFTYKPERWISSSDGSKTTGAFMAFSIGPRGCAGKSMAYQLVSIAMAKTLWYFDFELAENSGLGSSTQEGEFKMTDIFTSDNNGPWLKFKRRGELWRELVSESS